MNTPSNEHPLEVLKLNERPWRSLDKIRTLSSLQPMAPLPLPSSASTNPTSVHCLITCVASPDTQLSRERVQTHFISRVLSIPSFNQNDRKRQHAYFPPIPDINLYLAKRWYRRAMQHNRGAQDYIDNHTHDKRHIRSSRTTPLELIMN